MSDNERETFEHESYGMVGAYKVTGSGRRLFGSHTDGHHATIRLVIKRGTREHHLGQDWFYGGKQLIEIELTPAQWLSVITDMNTGDGHPCTLRYIEREQVEDPPEVPSETQAVMDHFVSESKGFVDYVESEVDEIYKILEKKSLLVKDRKRIASLLNKISMEIKSDQPFRVRTFMEATERVLSSAKIEAESYLALLVNRTGTKALSDPRVVKMLTDGDEE